MVERRAGATYLPLCRGGSLPEQGVASRADNRHVAWATWQRRASTLLGAAAGVCSAVSLVGWWFAPRILTAVGEWVLSVGFFVVFAGMIGLIVTVGMRREAARRREVQPGPSWFVRAPRRLILFLVVVCAAAVSSAIAGSLAADGYNAAAPVGSLNCAWPISKDHGAIVRCVGHDRWLRVDRGNEVAILAGLTLFACLECAVMAPGSGGVRVQPDVSATPARSTSR